MYEELLKRLRCQLHGNCPACVNWYTEEVEPNLWRERCAAIDAADAIEELQRYLDGLDGVCSDNDALCKRIDELSRELDAMNEANIALYGALPKWIPVEEELPEVRTWVLCYCRANSFDVFRLTDDGNWQYGNRSIYMKGYVTHWMPLPEPPREVAK